jgi:hypothetical protein
MEEILEIQPEGPEETLEGLPMMEELLILYQLLQPD